MRKSLVIGLAALVGCTQEMRIDTRDPSAYVVYVGGKEKRHEKDSYTFEAVRDISLVIECGNRMDTIHLEKNRFYRVGRSGDLVVIYEYVELQSAPHILQRYPPAYTCVKRED